MNVVLDSNILFSALISGKEAYLEILRAVNAYAPILSFRKSQNMRSELSRKQNRKLRLSCL